jgi:helix-hairpin-helix protein
VGVAIARCAALVPVALIAAAIAAPAAAPQNDRGELPEGEGRDTVLRLCVTSCHPATALTRARQTRDAWRALINSMRYKGDGMTLSPDEFRTVQTYLLRHFGRVDVNGAPKEDLELILDVAPDVAAAIAAFRKANGAFRTLDDLAQVPGLDPEQVGARKDRILFKPF